MDKGCGVKIRSEHAAKAMDPNVRRRKNVSENIYKSMGRPGDQIIQKLRRDSTQINSSSKSISFRGGTGVSVIEEVSEVSCSSVVEDGDLSQKFAGALRADSFKGGDLLHQEQHEGNTSPSSGNNGLNRGGAISAASSSPTALEVVPEVVKPTQYNLSKPPPKGIIAYVTGYGDPDGKATCCPNSNWAPDRIATKYLHWAFRSPFVFVFFNAAVLFFGMTFLFAFLYWMIGQYRPECVGGTDYEASHHKFTDAFALSWTTFSTVGYGAIYPAISSEYASIKECTGITILTTLESFVGILFASVFGAIMIAKVGRVQSYAQVIFSDPILIRFGSGVKAESQDYSSSDESDGDLKDLFVAGHARLPVDYDTSIPCPVMEFRIVNRLSSLPGGEIIDATINIVASVDVRQLGSDLLGAERHRRRKGKKGKKGGPRAKGRVRESRLSGEKHLFMSTRTERLRSVEEIMGEYKGHDDSADGESSHDRRIIVPKRRFTKLEVESPDHPFFKRVWNVRHNIDEMSPLVKPQVRKMIRDNDGCWPPELNSHEGVRASIAFDQILVSFSGTSNADANSVYAQHLYHYVNMNVGYRFVNVLYHDANDGSLCVDASLINDVTGQAGGGAEPILQSAAQMDNDMLVL